MGWSKSRSGSATSRCPADRLSGCLITKEWSPLDHGAIEHKHCCPNAGLVLVREFKGKTTAEPVEIDPL
ncbi:MAG TPA: hypothetical protein VJW16_02425 [Lysobacter sp.]|nr:hypothetical protein [Lysobacter sp.]